MQKELKSKSLKINYILKFLLLSINFLFPLISAPYVSRILGAENLGKVYFAQAIINFMIIIAGIGIPTYGIREVARLKHDRGGKLSKVTSELIMITMFSSIILTILYLIVIFNYNTFRADRLVFMVFGLNLMFSFMNLDWFFSGIEEFGYITGRNIFIKLLSLGGAIFTMVSSRDDYLLYGGGITVIALIVQNVINLLQSKKYISYNFKEIEIKKSM